MAAEMAPDDEAAARELDAFFDAQEREEIESLFLKQEDGTEQSGYEQQSVFSDPAPAPEEVPSPPPPAATAFSPVTVKTERLETTPLSARPARPLCSARREIT